MDQTLLLLLCVCVGFISGYGVRAMISEHRRREEHKAREARKAARKAREARLQQSWTVPAIAPHDLQIVKITQTQRLLKFSAYAITHA